ncbi:MAG: heavy-metal-associated domain-containing protein [Chloroflexota bacterium]
MTTKTFQVPNISCGHCVRTIENEVSELAGITQVTASEQTRMVTVSWEEGQQNWSEIEALLKEINYPPEA